MLTMLLERVQSRDDLCEAFVIAQRFLEGAFGPKGETN